MMISSPAAARSTTLSKLRRDLRGPLDQPGQVRLRFVDVDNHRTKSSRANDRQALARSARSRLHSEITLVILRHGADLEADPVEGDDGRPPGLIPPAGTEAPELPAPDRGPVLRLRRRPVGCRARHPARLAADPGSADPPGGPDRRLATAVPQHGHRRRPHFSGRHPDAPDHTWAGQPATPALLPVRHRQSGRQPGSVVHAQARRPARTSADGAGAPQRQVLRRPTTT